MSSVYVKPSQFMVFGYEQNKSNCEYVKKITKKWEEFALKKAETSDSLHRFQQNALMTSLIHNWSEDLIGGRFFICFDQSGNAQAIALGKFDELYIYISFLATNPHNIPTEEEDPERVRGAGSALISYLSKLSKRLGKLGVSGSATQYSIEFCSKVGFIKQPTCSKSDLTPMVLLTTDESH